MIIEKSIKLEIYPTDAPKSMTWNEARNWVDNIGDGWRIPTREELLFMYENRHVVGNFVTEYRGSGYARWYWSCTEDPEDPSYVFNVRFTDGGVDWHRKAADRLSLRLVRAVI